MATTSWGAVQGVICPATLGIGPAPPGPYTDLVVPKLCLLGSTVHGTLVSYGLSTGGRLFHRRTIPGRRVLRSHMDRVVLSPGTLRRLKDSTVSAVIHETKK
jgi:hypothetical protein